jgi:hypothetical protein
MSRCLCAGRMPVCHLPQGEKPAGHDQDDLECHSSPPRPWAGGTFFRPEAPALSPPSPGLPSASVAPPGLTV